MNALHSFCKYTTQQIQVQDVLTKFVEMQIESQQIHIDELQGERKQKRKQHIIKVDSRSSLLQEGEDDVGRNRPCHSHCHVGSYMATLDT